VALRNTSPEEESPQTFAPPARLRRSLLATEYRDLVLIRGAWPSTKPARPAINCIAVDRVSANSRSDQPAWDSA
jgi:hypothetical protein